MKIAISALVCALTFAAPAVQAQTGPTAAAATTTGTLRAGTSVPLKMSEALTTKGKKLKVGQRFQLETADNVTVDGNVVIPAGSPAVGEITEVRNKGMWGKSGRINARVLYVRANGRQIRMTGVLDDKGTTGTAGVVGAVALLPVAGFFMTGTSAEIPLGSPVKAFVDEDISVAVVPNAAPMVVAPAAPVSVQTGVAVKN
jgi:hypothetical protein